MASLWRLHENLYYGVTFTIALFIHLVCDSIVVKAKADTSCPYGGFTAHLIRKDSPHSPLYDHKRGRYLIGPDSPESILTKEKEAPLHLMKLTIGTPPVETYAIADTGSDLLWTQCKPCPGCLETTRDMFDPIKSSSYKGITCKDHECKFLKDTRNPCRRPGDNCSYTIVYGDRSYSIGTAGKETVALMSTSGKPVAFRDIVLGCGHNNTGLITRTEMGIIGLGRGPLSFVSQIAPFVGGKKFSHCLVHMDTDPIVTSKIIFGSGSEVSGDGTVSTPLVGKDVYYPVMLKGFTIGNNFVPSNSTTMILDSGTPMTHLPPNLYDQIVIELEKTLDPSLVSFSFTRFNFTILCTNTSTIPQVGLTVHFPLGAKVQLKPENVFMRNDELGDNMCTTFGKKIANDIFDNENMGIYGGFMLANFLVGFDLDKSLISIKPTDCTKIDTPTPPQRTGDL